jgi:hypothetical protein
VLFDQVCEGRIQCEIGMHSGKERKSPFRKSALRECLRERIKLCSIAATCGDLVCRRTPQAKIAQIMGKDPAWVSRTVKQIQADFSTVQATPNESGIIRENLVRWETIYADARRVAAVSEGFARISALRVCAEVLRNKAEYEVTVGWVANRRADKNGARGPTWEEVNESISYEDLKDLFITVGKRFEQDKKVLALPQPADTAN